MAPDVCPVHQEDLDLGWPVRYDPDPDVAGPDTQVRLYRSAHDGRVYLRLEQAVASCAVLVHLNRHAARELARALSEAVAAWDQLVPEPTDLGATPDPKDR